MKLDKKKITELARGKKKEQLSSVLSHIVRNMKQLLARACPGFLYASCSLAKKKLNLTYSEWQINLPLRSYFAISDKDLLLCNG